MTQPDDAATLRIPVIDPQWSNLELALALAAAGFYVLPTRADGDAKHAGSVLGAGWPAKSSRDPQVIVDWYAGTDHRVAIHCGRSGVVAFDLDHPERLPEKLGKAIANEVPPYQSTRPDEPGRGHYLFTQPAGRRIGNRAGDLGKDWGEVRGANGIILVGGEGREWLQTGDVPGLPPYLAELLPDVGDAETAVSDDELLRFVTAHTSELHPKAMQAVLDGFERQVQLGSSRHDAMISHACWAVRECVAGRYPAQKVLHRLERLFVEAMAVAPPGERALARHQAEAEFTSGVAWAIGQEWHPDGAELDPDRPDLAEAARAAWVESEVVAEMERLRIREQARQRLDAENREPLRVLSADEFLDAPTPDYLVPKMLYRDGLAVVFGPPGAAKSFLVLDIALCLATGRPWRGRLLGRGRVHYVMAEGQATNTLRARAWLHYHEADRSELRSWWSVVPTAVMLTEAGSLDYLALVERDKPDLIVLDTKNLMFVGKESQGDDYGAMLRILHRIREAAGGCCVVLVDHSGLGDDSRTRGSNAQKGGIETEVRVTDLGGVRRAEVTRDKSGRDGAEWFYRLEQVDAVLRPPDVDAPAVCVPVEADEVQRGDVDLRDSCWDVARAALPEVVAKLTGAPGEAACDLFRMLAYIDPEGNPDVVEMTFTAMFTHLSGSPRKHTRPTAHRALHLLVAAEVVKAPEGSKSYALVEGFRGWGRSE
jgi:hypothetical protein